MVSRQTEYNRGENVTRVVNLKRLTTFGVHEVVRCCHRVRARHITRVKDQTCELSLTSRQWQPWDNTINKLSPSHLLLFSDVVLYDIATDTRLMQDTPEEPEIRMSLYSLSSLLLLPADLWHF